MFLQAGFNPEHRNTGIWAFTVHERSSPFFRPAQLIVFEGGDFAWHGRGFLSWGDFLTFRTDWKIEYAMREALVRLADAIEDFDEADKILPWHIEQRTTERLTA